MSEDIKAQFQRFVDEVLNTGNYERLEEFVAHDETYNGVQIGAEGYRQNHESIRAAFPDFHISIDRMIAEGDMLAVEMTWSGTHMGHFRGIEATGKHVSFRSFQFRRNENGKTVEGWGMNDNYRLLKQLGASIDQYELEGLAPVEEMKQ